MLAFVGQVVIYSYLEYLHQKKDCYEMPISSGSNNAILEVGRNAYTKIFLRFNFFVKLDQTKG